MCTSEHVYAYICFIVSFKELIPIQTLSSNNSLLMTFQHPGEKALYTITHTSTGGN